MTSCCLATKLERQTTDKMVSIEGCCMLRSNKKWESYIFGLIKKLSFYCNLFWGMVMPCKRQELLPTRFNVKTTVYIRTVRFQHLLSTLLNQLKLVYGPFGQRNMHSTFDFYPTPARKEANVQQISEAYCPEICILWSRHIWTIWRKRRPFSACLFLKSVQSLGLIP